MKFLILPKNIIFPGEAEDEAVLAKAKPRKK